MSARRGAAVLAAVLGAAIAFALLVVVRSRGDVPCFAGDPMAASPPAPESLARGAAVVASARELTLDVVQGSQVGKRTRVAVKSGTLVAISGWAADMSAQRRARAVLVWVDGRPPVRADVCGEREDVARAYANARLAQTGFTVRVPVAPGAHALSFGVLAADGRTLYRIARGLELDGVGPAVTSVREARPRSAPAAVSAAPAARTTPAALVAPRVPAPVVQGDLTTADGASVPNSVRDGAPFVHPAGVDLVFVGWVVDRTGVVPARVRSVEVLIDGRPVARAAYGSARPDVAAFVHAPGVLNSGFSARVFTDDLRPGRHALGIVTTLADGRTANWPEKLVLDLTAR